MKETINKKMREASVLLIAVVMVLSTVAVTANTNDQSSELMLADADYISHPQQTNTFDPDWIHFDDGTPSVGVGVSNGGTFEGAIRITPDELVGYDGWEITVVKWYHFVIPGTSETHSGKIKIYEAGTSTQPGALLTSEAYTVTGDRWKDIILSEAVTIDAGEDIWVSVEVTHASGEFPITADAGPAIDGKGDWYSEGSDWSELQDYGFDYNWNIWAKVEVGSQPPEKPQRPEGSTEGTVGVEYTFCTNTTDPEGEQVYYMWDWGDDTSSEWIGPFDSGATACANHAWNEAGTYEITVKAKDIHGKKSDWSDPLTIHIVDMPILEIGNITGRLFKVCTVIKNTGGVDATKVNWSIILDGGFILLGKETNGTLVNIPAGDEAKISSSLILGFGNTVITVSAECDEGSSDTNTRDAFVFLFFIL